MSALATPAAASATSATSAIARTRFDLRLAFRLHRFELVGFTLLVVGLSAAAVGLAGLLDATGYGASCNPLVDNPPQCEAMGRRFYDLQASWVSMVHGLLLAVPFLLGIVAGPALVAREIERGTGRLAWSLAPSRTRWYLARLVPLAAAVFGLALVAGLALDRLTGGVEPWTDPWQSFSGFGMRGVAYAARVEFVFAIGVAAGAIVGRTLPALLLAAVIGWVGIAGGSYVHGRWTASEAVFVDDATGAGVPGALWVDQRLRDPSGRILTWDEASAIVPPDDGTGVWPPPGWTFVTLLVPGERYPFVQAREVAALAGASLVAFGIAGFAVRRRRPG